MGRKQNWEIFGIIFLIPLLLVMFLPDDFAKSKLPFFVIIRICVFSYFTLSILYWNYCITRALENKSKQLKFELNKNKKSAYKLSIYLILFLYLILIYFLFIVLTGETPSRNLAGMAIGSFILIFSLFFYINYYVSYLLNQCEHKTEAKFANIVSDVVMLFFFPVGIWFFQPRVNKVIS